MMRVLFIAGYDHPAYHRKVELLADAPDLEILHVTVAGYGKLPGEYASANGERSYRVRAFPAHWLGRRGDPHRGYLWPPHYDMHRFKPDVVHLESDVETLGTAEIVTARGLLAPHSKLVAYSWQNILRPRSLPVRLVSGFVLRAADHVVCASCEAADVLRREGFRRGTSVMPLVGLDCRRFYPRGAPATRAQLGPTGFVVGYVGRLAPEKGLDILLSAAERMSAPAELLIVGSGSEGPALRAQAKALGVDRRCRFVEAVEYDRVPEYLNAVDVLVLPSRTTVQWKEQFGRVLIEAMGCKVPVVGSDSGAIPEVIGGTGRIFPEGDASALAAVLDELASAVELRRQLGERGYARVMANYTVEQLALLTADVWREVATDRR